jgi:hypothetical protein
VEYYLPDNKNFSICRVPIPLKRLGGHKSAKNAVHRLPQQLQGGRNNLANKNQI